MESAQKFEQFLDKNKKNYSCYELANGYLKLETYYYTLNDYNKIKKFSDLVTKYADGKNYLFQLQNLYNIYLGLIQSKNPNDKELFILSHNIYFFLIKYTPFTTDEIKSLMDYNIEKKTAQNISTKKGLFITCENFLNK